MSNDRLARGYILALWWTFVAIVSTVSIIVIAVSVGAM